MLLILPAPLVYFFSFFFLNDPATTEIYPLPLHDALPIYGGEHRHRHGHRGQLRHPGPPPRGGGPGHRAGLAGRSEEHTSELQSQSNLVCRLLLEKKKKNRKHTPATHIQTTNVAHNVI